MRARLPDISLKDKTIFEDDEMRQGPRAHKQHQSPDANDDKFRKNTHEETRFTLSKIENGRSRIEKMTFSIFDPPSSIFDLLFSSIHHSPLYCSGPWPGVKLPVEAWRKTGHNRTNSSGLFALPPLELSCQFDSVVLIVIS